MRRMILHMKQVFIVALLCCVSFIVSAQSKYDIAEIYNGTTLASGTKVITSDDDVKNVETILYPGKLGQIDHRPPDETDHLMPV